MGGTYTDFTTYAASQKKGYHAWSGVAWVSGLEIELTTKKCKSVR